MISFIISYEEKNQTIISFLKKRFKNSPLSLIYKLLRSKKIKLNNQNIRYYHHRLKKDDEIIILDQSLKVSPVPSFEAPPTSTNNIEIVYEDNNVLIVIKEHNIPMRNTTDCLDRAINHYLYEQNAQEYKEKINSYFTYTAIHRLDKLSKGLVIYPKNNETKKILYNCIKNKEKITKKYLAICEIYSNYQPPSFIEGFIYKDEEAQKMIFSRKKPTIINKETKYCAMETEVKKTYKEKKINLLEITLDTGRKHQIRAALSFFNFPVLGDWKYGSKRYYSKSKIQLFAYQIKFNNIPQPLHYLNNKIFSIDNLENQLINEIKNY